MLDQLKIQLRELIAESLGDLAQGQEDSLSLVELEIPKEKQHGDFSTNFAMRLCKLLRKKPVELAQIIVENLEGLINKSPLKDKIEKVEIKGPGFINFHLSTQAYYEVLYDVFKRKDNYGRPKAASGQKIQIEFVSANPTGPLSVAHARQAVVGDALGNILSFLGCKVVKEYYVNDEGNQINILGKSIQLRAQEILGQTIEFPEDHYQGEYVKDIAKEFLEKNKIKDAGALEKKELVDFADYGVKYLMKVIKDDLNDFGVHFDTWSHQSKIATQKAIVKVLEELKKKGFVYEKDGAQWFKSTDFGDDKDRVVKKSDGSYTYLTPDIVYHKDKYARGFDQIYNIWGPDHHGYIPRIKAAAAALGHDIKSLEVLIVQLATIYRDGQPVSMSTRRGQFISLREVIDEVGVDAARFFFLMRHIKAHLDFDLDLAKNQAPENPVFYIQYAHARIHSILRAAKEAKLKSHKKEFKLLEKEEEIDLMQLISQFTDILFVCKKQMDPFAVISYMQELASSFHRFYDRHKVIDPDNTDMSAERLALIDAVRIVLANGLRLIGVSTPERM